MSAREPKELSWLVIEPANPAAGRLQVFFDDPAEFRRARREFRRAGFTIVDHRESLQLSSCGDAVRIARDFYGDTWEAGPELARLEARP